MTVRRPLISLGDALRAAADLSPGDAETKAAILRMLGLKIEVTTPSQKSIGAWKPSSTENVVIAQRDSLSNERFAASASEAQQLPALTHRAALMSVIKQIRKGSGVFDPPDWFKLSRESLGPESDSGPPPPTPALFRRVVRRGILSAVISTLVPEGELDTDRILGVLADGRPLERLPRLPTPTLRRGVQILVDRAPAMDPFRQDQSDLVKALDDLLAHDRYEVLDFAGSPGRGVGSGARSTWRPWKPPARGIPILTITDLGIGGPMLDEDRATTGEWLRFAQRARNQGNLVMALVPYEALRWPPTLARVISIIHWSERATAGEILRAIRDVGHRL